MMAKPRVTLVVTGQYPVTVGQAASLGSADDRDHRQTGEGGLNGAV